MKKSYLNISRRKFLLAGGGVAAGGLLSGGYAWLVEPHRFDISRRKIPGSFSFDHPLKIVHMADFHASDAVPFRVIEAAVDLALEQKPDLAVLTGDFITWDMPDPTEYSRVLNKLASHVPCYACLGNHDGGRWAGSTKGLPDASNVGDMLKKANARLLFNEKETIRIDGREITLVGMGDYWSNDLKPREVLQERDFLKAPKNAPPVVVLSHNPDSKVELRRYDWDVLLCGHTHGGQFSVPVVGYRPFLPVHDKSMPEGLFPYDGRWINISRGVGSLHSLRFNCRPEISVIELG